MPRPAPTRERKLHGRRQRRNFLERLEPRHLLAGDLQDPWDWFESIDGQSRMPLAALATMGQQDRPEIGPHDRVTGEWIVQLTDEATASARTLRSIGDRLNLGSTEFEAVAGLGAPGLVLLRTRSVSSGDVSSILAANATVSSFGANSLVEGQQTPNDPEFLAGRMPGLGTTTGAGIIDAPRAWDSSTGSTDVVVGVVDGGIDATHADLFLNIWLNQGEIPATIRDQLVDVDGDKLITFYDLNNLKVDPADGTIQVASTGVAATTEQATTATPFATGANATFVEDENGNGRIDAVDLLDDVTWADGRDTDGNTFFDDLFGVNFRAGAGDPFPENRPLDQRGHGTHVAGTIGAVGNNGFGVVGVNWQTQLMSLRILDDDNRSDAAAAIRAINYARQMRSELTTSDDGSVLSGANVRVLNNSWGQPGGFEPAFEAAISDLGDDGVLFVAASGNGNILNVGVDNDNTPFYPASYESDNVIAVAAVKPASAGAGLASFSNFGATSVDIGAPGVDILSTLPGGVIGPANGTSMAAPHVAGAAALIWSAFPAATVAEVKEAILTSTTEVPALDGVVQSGGQLDVGKAINANVFAPAARLVQKENITTPGGASTEFVVEYSHRNGINTATIGNDDLVVTRQWGPADQFTPSLVGVSIPPGDAPASASVATATYRLDAPGGSWDPLDFGDYQISTVAGNVSTADPVDTVRAREIGSFNVRIESPEVLYVDTFGDVPGENSLRDAIIAANADAPAHRTIILDAGKFVLETAHVADPGSTFPYPSPSLFCGGVENVTGFSNATTGDFDVTGSISIVGNQNNLTTIDAMGVDRVFKVHPGATLELERVRVTGGVSPPDQGGGGILSAGTLRLEETIVDGNRAVALQGEPPIRGGGIAAWAGTADISRSWIKQNNSDFGGGVFYCGVAGGSVTQSTLSGNNGGGLHSHSDSNLTINNSTFSANVDGRGAIFNGKRDGFGVGEDASTVPSVSDDGNLITFVTRDSDLVDDDLNQEADLFLYNRETDRITRIGIPPNGIEPDGGVDERSPPQLNGDGSFVVFTSFSTNLVPGVTDFGVFRQEITTGEIKFAGVGGLDATISADGRFVAYASFFANVPDDTSEGFDVFVFDGDTETIRRVSVASDGSQGDGFSNDPKISENGRFVTYVSSSTNLVTGDTNGQQDVFVHDLVTGVTERVSVSSAGAESNGTTSSPSISGDGRFVAFRSFASNLHPGDTDTSEDHLVFDRQTNTIELLPPSAGAVGVPNISEDGNSVVVGNTLFDRAAGTFKTIAPQFSVDFGATDISADGSFVVLGLREFDDETRDDLENIVIFDRALDSTERILETPTQLSTAVGSQLTVAHNRGTDVAVSGAVALEDVLFSGNVVTTDTDATVTSTATVLSSLEIGVDRIGPLSSESTLPPVHALQIGNPAIDAGALTGTVDQLDTPRLTSPDIGAFETISGSVAGRVFVDLNNNQALDAGEPLVPGVRVTANSDSGIVEEATSSANAGSIGQIRFSSLDPQDLRFTGVAPDNFSISTTTISRVQTANIQPNVSIFLSSLSDDGRFGAFVSGASNLVAGDTNNTNDAFVYDRQNRTIERVSVNASGEQGNGFTNNATISSDGRFVAFESASTNLIANDTNGGTDIFVFDRQTRAVSRVNVGPNGEQAIHPGSGIDSFGPSFSPNGRFIAYKSSASNIVPGDSNGSDLDYFVYDRETGLTEIINRNNAGEQGGEIGIANESAPTFSFDGRFVTFSSRASNLVPGDTNGFRDAFVYDRENDTIERVSVDSNGNQGIPNPAPFLTLGAERPIISRDGRFVVYQSDAQGLAPGDDTDRFLDVFLFDRTTGTNTRLSANQQGVQANGTSSLGGLSGNGRFVTIFSTATNLVPDDTNNQFDAFVIDLDDGTRAIVSVAADGTPSNGRSSPFAINADGSIIGFSSSANNLIPGDTNQLNDSFIAPNPLIPPGQFRSIQIGDVIEDLDIGLIPDPGRIRGTVFEDTIKNSVIDAGENRLSGWTVFLDGNANRILDSGETFVTTDAQGRYVFDSLASFRNFGVAVQPPSGWEQIAPGQSNGFAHNLFLPAGGDITGRDFAFRRVTGTAQSRDSSVSGRIYTDVNGDGDYDDGIDIPRANTDVFLDVQNFGVRDPNEIAAETDADGVYRIDRIGASVVAVTTILDPQTVQVSPLGSEYSLDTFPLFDPTRTFGELPSPQAILSTDFNQDTFPDVAVAIAGANLISIRLNDGSGGFLPDVIDIDMKEDGGLPTSLVSGQFNGAGTGVDLAVVNNAKSNVVVLLDFDPVTNRFTSQTKVDNLGDEPFDVVTANITGDSDQDLVVVNKQDSTIRALLNDGSGTFTAQSPVGTGGVQPVSIVSGHFDADSNIDVAVAHFSPATNDTPFGDVRVLTGDGAGGFTLTPTPYPVGANPSDMVAANFDGDTDGRLDLAVANFGSNSISILTGNGDGTFTVQSESLGTASGALDLAAADIDNDGDVDVVASNLRDRNVSTFRNITSTAGSVKFEPLEAVGLAQFSASTRMPLVLDNFDQDTSVGGEGTIDIVAIPVLSRPSLNVLLNTLVDGARRVQLTGTNQVSDLDFIIRPADIPPTIDTIPDPDPIVEDAGIQTVGLAGISRGRVGGDPLRIEAFSSNPSVLPDPVISSITLPSATLTYAANADASGQAMVTVVVTDPGADGVIDSPDDVQKAVSFSVTIQPVNDPPTFQLPASNVIQEDAGSQLILLGGVSAGPGEFAQFLSPFSVTTGRPEVFLQLPSVSAQGELSFTLLPDFFGGVTMEVSLNDDGGTSNGGVDQTTKTLVLEVLPVNDAPSITIGQNQSALNDADPQAIAGFASGFIPGPAGESLQTISDFVVTNDNNEIFRFQPDVTDDGTLTFTPSPTVSGFATVTVQVRDSGGTERGGVDLSAVQAFVIAINPIPDTTAPLPVITTDQPALTNLSSFEITVDFGETVTGFEAADVIASGATVSEPVDFGEGRFTLTVTASADGPVSINIPAGAADDLADNASLASETLSLTVDGTALVPVLSTESPSPRSDAVFDVSIDFGELVTGLDAGDITVVNGTVSGLSDQGNGQFTAQVTGNGDGAVTVVVPAAAAQDAADNDSLTSGQLTVIVDSTAPTPTLSLLGVTPNSQSTFNVEVDFGETVTGFDESDLTLSSGSVASLVDRGAGRFVVTVADLSEGLFTLGLSTGAATDGAGNASLAVENLTQEVTIVDLETIVLTGSGNTFFLTQPDSQLDGVRLIDIRGDGDNTLVLDPDRIRDVFQNGTIRIESDSGDALQFGDGWAFVDATLDGDSLVRRFVNSGATVDLIGPDDFTNPITRFDVNARNGTTSLDALQIINELSRRLFSDDQVNAGGAIRPLAGLDFSKFRFYDVNRDFKVTALDALQVINELARQPASGEGESIGATLFASTPARQETDVDVALREIQWDHLTPSSKPQYRVDAEPETQQSFLDFKESDSNSRTDPEQVALTDDAISLLWSGR